MGSIHPYQTKDGKRYLVRYRKPDNAQSAKRGFVRKKDAEDFLATVTITLNRGDYLDPGRGKVRLDEIGEVWLTIKLAKLKPSSFHPVESAWRVHVKPKWGSRQISSIGYLELQEWVSGLSKTHGATSVIRAYGVIAAILDLAVKDKRIAANPARDGIELPAKTRRRHPYLSHEQVTQLARNAAHPTLVYFLAYTGLRWGEATGLRIKDADFERRRILVFDNAVLVNNTIHVGSPKDDESRPVPVPRFLIRSLQTLAAGKPRDALLFGDGNAHMRSPNSQAGWFAGAVKRCQKNSEDFPRLTIHDLRHTAASLAISAGANVKAVQRMLGHASAAMTLDIYADLFDDDLDTVADALDTARAVSLDRADHSRLKTLPPLDQTPGFRPGIDGPITPATSDTPRRGLQNPDA